MKRKILCITIVMIIIASISTKTTANDFFEDNDQMLSSITEDVYEQNKDDNSSLVEEIKKEPVSKEDIQKENIETSTEENKEQFYENEIVEEIQESIETKEEAPKKNNKTNNFDEYVGRFKIPSVGVNVGCYASNNQKTVDAIDSAAYYYGYGHTVIADHNNQGFNVIKSCKVGTKATIETDTKVENLTCVGIIQGHNNGVILTDKDGNAIDDLYPGAVACYTCNDNWKNITIVFFMPDSKLENKNNNNNKNESKSEQEESIIYDCKNGNHKWKEPKFEWGGELKDGRKFHWESIVCRFVRMKIGKLYTNKVYNN